MTPRRIFAFLQRYLPGHPLYVAVYGIAYFLKDFSFDVHIYSKEEVARAIEEGKSIIRFGDGEINPMLGLRNHYHKYSPQLGHMMRDIVRRYRPGSPFILAMPKFITYSNEELKGIGKFNVWLPIKTVFFLSFPKDMAYMDAHSFYYDGYLQEVVIPRIKDKHVIIVTKQETIDRHRKEAHSVFPSVSYVAAGEENIIATYASIKDKVLACLAARPEEDSVVLFALGPVGKFMTAELSEEGYQCIDVGVALETIYSRESLEWRI